MKVSHESPRVLLKESRTYNDYDYALCHLFKDDIEYYEFFKESLRIGRTVYLDNGLFETGEMFDHAEFAHYVTELGSINPDNFYYIVPDSLEETQITIDSFIEFTDNYPDLPGKSIGVVQGKTYDEIKLCYQFMSDYADMVAISFDYSWYQEIRPDERNKFYSWMYGRQQLTDMLIRDGIWNENIPHHYLGCGLPQEFTHYKNILNIVSCDTSNPIVHAIKGIQYNDWGLDSKESIKLVDLFETPLESIDSDILDYNIRKFKEFCDESSD